MMSVFAGKYRTRCEVEECAVQSLNLNLVPLFAFGSCRLGITGNAVAAAYSIRKKPPEIHRYEIRFKFRCAVRLLLSSLAFKLLTHRN